MNKVRDVGSNVDHSKFTLEEVESNMVRCPDKDAAQKMIDGGRVRPSTRTPGTHNLFMLCVCHCDRVCAPAPSMPPTCSHQRGSHARGVVRRGGDVRGAQVPRGPRVSRV